MAKKIPQLDNATTFASGHWFVINDGVKDYKMTKAQLEEWIGLDAEKQKVITLQQKALLIEESGSEPNGRYTKFSDGTLIMTVTSNATLAYAKAVTATVNLPLSAINANYQVQLSYAYDLPDAIRGKTTVHARNKTTSSFQIVMQTQDNFFDATNASNVRIDYVIYGRWK